MTEQDGGRAMPVVLAGVEVDGGMSLRDWFAGQALAAIQPAPATGMAERAYQIADAMLFEKGKPND